MNTIAAVDRTRLRGDTGGECVGHADLTAHIALRDSKKPAGGRLAVAPEAFARFAGAAARGELQVPGGRLQQ
ncbi:DUF397 domain-containing protein [Streptomyces sp. NPDC021356]|uniref:DUF397 domain-containing protein n=1 Tax=Streptomyces sp. NPDC021356 TaxID=3154900 RepID=UPI0033EC4FA2